MENNGELNLEDFNEWNSVKKYVHSCATIHAIKEGDVWWCAVGRNIGVEINGKGDKFARPVVVLRKLSRYSFIGVPLTSQEHEGSWYVKFVFQSKHQTAVLSQIKAFSVFRTYRKMGKLSKRDLTAIKDGLGSLLGIKIPPVVDTGVDG